MSTRKRRAAKRPAAPAHSEFMKRAYAMELEAAERYGEFADQMEVHNNREVAELFRKLGAIEARHAAQIREQMGWKSVPSDLPAVRWERGREGPETASPGELHYLMQPYHALEIALANEERAARFFGAFARRGRPAALRAVAAEMAREEREHVRLVRDWLARVPAPEPGWDRDPDPPNPDGE
jgi:rubrerythrin